MRGKPTQIKRGAPARRPDHSQYDPGGFVSTKICIWIPACETPGSLWAVQEASINFLVQSISWKCCVRWQNEHSYSQSWDHNLYFKFSLVQHSSAQWRGKTVSVSKTIQIHAAKLKSRWEMYYCSPNMSTNYQHGTWLKFYCCQQLCHLSLNVFVHSASDHDKQQLSTVQPH